VTTGEVYRIDWVPGTDLLHGRCHCGTEHTAQNPEAMWSWMLAHPDHPLTPSTPGTPGTPERSTR